MSASITCYPQSVFNMDWNGTMLFKTTVMEMTYCFFQMQSSLASVFSVECKLKLICIYKKLHYVEYTFLSVLFGNQRLNLSSTASVKFSLSFYWQKNNIFPPSLKRNRHITLKTVSQSFVKYVIINGFFSSGYWPSKWLL